MNVLQNLMQIPIGRNASITYGEICLLGVILATIFWNLLSSPI